MNMADEELLRRFRRCLAYYGAPSWLKLFLNPARLIRNQYRTRVRPPPPGVLSRVRAFHLDRFTVVSGECVSEQIACYGIYEPALTRGFLQLVRPGQRVLDVGMHLGYFTTLFAKLTGTEGEVHAFEPTPSTRELAANNVAQFPQVTVHPQALWSSAQELTFRDYGWRWMAFNSLAQSRLTDVKVVPTEYRVQTTTLDLVRGSMDQPISLVKIDAESAELEILKGAEALLAGDRPVVSLEVGDPPQGPPSSRGLVRWFSERSYVPWEWREGRFRRHEALERYEYDNLVFAPAHQDLGAL